MDLNYTSDEESFRAEVRRFIDAELARHNDAIAIKYLDWIERNNIEARVAYLTDPDRSVGDIAARPSA